MQSIIQGMENCIEENEFHVVSGGGTNNFFTVTFVSEDKRAEMQLQLDMHELASIPEMSVHPPQQNKLYC